MKTLFTAEASNTGGRGGSLSSPSGHLDVTLGNPLEAGAFVVEHVKNVMKHQVSGVELRLLESGNR